MAVIKKYTAHTIEPDILSRLNVDQAGDVVSAETWVALWELVLHLLGKYNEHFVDIYRTLGELGEELDTCIKRVDNLEGQYNGLVERMGNLENSWSALQEAYNKVAGCYDEIKQIQNTLESGFVHYGENPPTTDFIKLWVMPTQGVPSLITSWGENDILATNYNYASAKLIKDTLNTKVNKAGDTITGPLVFNAGLATHLQDINNRWHINFNGDSKFNHTVVDAIRIYTDDDTDHDIVFGKSHGSHVVGASLGGHRVRNVGAPIEDTDAATKEYVDTHQDLNLYPSEDIALWECGRIYKTVINDNVRPATLHYTHEDGTVIPMLTGYAASANGIAFKTEVTINTPTLEGPNLSTTVHVYFFNGKNWSCTSIDLKNKTTHSTYLNLTQVIDELSTDETYPTALAVVNFVTDYVANNHKLREIPSDAVLEWEPDVWYSTATWNGAALWVEGYSVVSTCGVGIACVNKYEYAAYTTYEFTYIDAKQHVYAVCKIDNTDHVLIETPAIYDYTFADNIFKNTDNNNVPTVNAVKEYTAEYVRSKVEKATDAFKATASGELLQITDVSEVEHTVTVEASGDVLVNERATIVACGKNLCDVEHGSGFVGLNDTNVGRTNTEIQCTDDGVSIKVTKNTSNAATVFLYLGTFPAGIYTVSVVGGDIKTNETSGVTGTALAKRTPGDTALPSLYSLATQGTATTRFAYIYTGVNSFNINLTETTELWIRAQLNNSTGSEFVYNNVQVEFGTEATPYEFFCGGSGDVGKYAYSTNSFSTHVSNTQVLNVFSTVPGVTLTCQYNKHSNKVLEDVFKYDSFEKEYTELSLNNFLEDSGIIYTDLISCLEQDYSYEITKHSYETLYVNHCPDNIITVEYTTASDPTPKRMTLDVVSTFEHDYAILYAGDYEAYQYPDAQTAETGFAFSFNTHTEDPLTLCLIAVYLPDNHDYTSLKIINAYTRMCCKNKIRSDRVQFLNSAIPPIALQGNIPISKLEALKGNATVLQKAMLPESTEEPVSAVSLSLPKRDYAVYTCLGSFNLADTTVEPDSFVFSVLFDNPSSRRGVSRLLKIRSIDTQFIRHFKFVWRMECVRKDVYRCSLSLLDMTYDNPAHDTVEYFIDLTTEVEYEGWSLSFRIRSEDGNYMDIYAAVDSSSSSNIKEDTSKGVVLYGSKC